MTYSEEDFLQISGLQHFAFCRRQWALIHIEKQWAENYFTADGAVLHERAHDREFEESRGGLLIRRCVSVFSAELGASGQCDVLEYRQGAEGVPLPGREGLWQPYPVEYKRGSPRENQADVLQLCAQAICLENMLCCEVPEGALFYGETRRRERIVMTQELRAQVKNLFAQMHDLYRRGYTPKVKPAKACSSCSLKELCLPKLLKTRSVTAWLKDAAKEVP